MILGLTQPLTEMSTRNVFWGKGGRWVGLTILPPSCANCLEIWEPQPPGTLRACPGLKWDCFTFFSMKGEENQVHRIRCDRGNTVFQTVLSLAKHIQRHMLTITEHL